MDHRVTRVPRVPRALRDHRGLKEDKVLLDPLGNLGKREKL